MDRNRKRTTREKIDLFMRYFSGRMDVHGTFDPATGRAWQVKEPVTRNVILAHLKGERPFGVYLLRQDRTSAVAVDFDDGAPLRSLEFVHATGRYELPVYLERSKFKGYHAWLFFEGDGVLAAKARLVVRNILEEIETPETEVFPKQDSLSDSTFYGNFINSPLFGGLVPVGRTVFIDENLTPYPNQWDFLESIHRVSADWLDEIIDLNEWEEPPVPEVSLHANSPGEQGFGPRGLAGLPPCARRILAEGVSRNQRVACFRLAVHLRKVGLPEALAVASLEAWASRNRPSGGKRIITTAEIRKQVACAYAKPYRSCGCEDPAIAPFCDPACPVKAGRPAAASEIAATGKTTR